MLSSIIETVESYGTWAMIGFCFALLIAALILTKYGIARPWYRIVRSTAAEWDDLLFESFSKRLYLFIIVGSINLSVNWIIAADSEHIATLNPIFSVAYILLSTSLASVIVKYITPAVAERFSKKSSVTVSGGNPIISFFIRTVIWFAGLNLAMKELSWDLSGLFASLAVFSLILGIAMQQTIGNIMNSFMLAVDRPFEVGDRIEVEGLTGSVVSVGVLSTKILTHEETLVVIPNNKLVETTLINHARGGGDGKARRISLVIEIGVDYREDIGHVKYTLLELAKRCPYVITNPSPRVLLTELGDFSKTFKVISWVEDYTDEWIARDWLLKEIDERFTEEEIVIPFPTAVELTERSGENRPSAKKAQRQSTAKAKMVKEENKMRKEREEAKTRVVEIDEILKTTSAQKRDVPVLEDEKRTLENKLAMFEVDDD
ncbi:MAG TPA: mechanosensitive ion channel family protein [Candidatus Poseidoniales archaeon]|nr:mechanosensitive ion channel family protein [Candidatus Poseidoniales archaeon]